MLVRRPHLFWRDNPAAVAAVEPLKL